MVAYTCNPRVKEAVAGDWEFKASLGNMRTHLNKTKNKWIEK